MPIALRVAPMRARSGLPVTGCRLYRGLIVVVALLAACSAQAPLRTPPTPPEARRQFEDARRLEEEGRGADAVELYRRAVRTAPGFVAAHRALQNLEIADHRRGELLQRYGAWRDSEPGSAERWYLWGRLLADPARQREAFEKAHALDPRSPWPLLGLGHLDLSAGKTTEALESFRRGREFAPDLRELELGYVRALVNSVHHFDEAERLLADVTDGDRWDVARCLLLAELRARQKRPREALETLGRLLARVPRNEEVAGRLLERLARDGTAEDALWLVRELEVARSEEPVRHLLARCHAMLGDADEAIALWDEAERLTAEEAARRRLLRVVRGEFTAALATETPRFKALAAFGAASTAFDEACAVVRASAGGALDRVALAAAFSRLGWVEEAIVTLRPAASGGALEPGATRLLVRLFGQRQLEAELTVLALDAYRIFDAEQLALDFDAFLRRVGEAGRRALGDDLLDGAARLSWWPVGELLDPVAEGGLVGYFRRCGRMLLVGQRSGRPPEIVLAPVLAATTAGPQQTPMLFLDGISIPSFLEHQGARFSGAALVRLAWIDVAAVEDDVTRLLARAQEVGSAVERVLADPVLAAKDRRERRRVDEPAEVTMKLELKALADWRTRSPAGDRVTLLAEALDAVVVHETGHLEDADRFLPFSDHLLGNIGRLIGFGFSPRAVEEWLEMRAELVALSRARNPYLVLAACTGQVGGEPGTLTPHGGGYRELLERLVAVVDEHERLFPALDRGCVLVQQLDRLSPQQIRLAARLVLADLGMEE